MRPAFLLIVIANPHSSAMAENKSFLKSIADENLSQLTGLSDYNISMGS
jgi:hypothetical protein